MSLKTKKDRNAAHHRLTQSTAAAWAQAQMLSRPLHKKTKSGTAGSSLSPTKKYQNSSIDGKRVSINGSTRSNYQNRKGSASTREFVPMYMNVTGPGDYTVPSFASRTFGEIESNKRTAPGYTIRPKTKQPYWPSYEVDFKGQDSPGMTLYNPKRGAVVEVDPAFSVPKADRFYGVDEKNRRYFKDV